MSKSASPPCSPAFKFPLLPQNQKPPQLYNFLTDRAHFLALRRHVSIGILSSVRSANYYEFMQSITDPANTTQLNWINARAHELKGLKTRRAFIRWLEKHYELLHGEDLLAWSDVLSDTESPEPQLPGPVVHLEKTPTADLYRADVIAKLVVLELLVVGAVSGIWWFAFADEVDVAYMRSIWAVARAMLLERKSGK
ncbi:hypothetical protein OGAPHI_006203 [Ogataea philodendri]|uniref:Uncharacterized protein n=1 Tax=Ogataea philodendri TaxID=1378263 RepID=A0A9P8NZE3_9ASCO|nr:uncharacterized protein OGAPHI_006203 [Ogataea philodendri]KAH3662022.1 hypothetical protein OGAPHI_006203 [Ogataea philodendri]